MDFDENCGISSFLMINLVTASKCFLCVLWSLGVLQIFLNSAHKMWEYLQYSMVFWYDLVTLKMFPSYRHLVYIFLFFFLHLLDALFLLSSLLCMFKKKLKYCKTSAD